ncbi:Hypothetical predicted protein [Drosophila guanche]|uniref:Uncharacterized protein n=1 Tax=Drosophila guanche TaxID=7266 RepID=A0A3B0JNH2_DROGU|nr:Hypothetical predicted protein [Drosophila guanche]
MKASCYLCIILGLILHLAMSSSSSRTTEGAQSCKKNVQSSCNATTRSCGRFGRANLCQAFKNDCQRRISNCNNKGLTALYRKVNYSLCKNMPLDRKLPCGKSVIITNGNGSSSSSSSSSTPSSRCVSTSSSCFANSNVCGRWSTTRRCHRFRNRCLMERANCRTSVSSWNVVNLGNCTSISVNRTGTCISTFSSTSSSSSTSTSSSTGGWASILSSLLGSSSSSNITPIIIRRG